MDYDSFVFCLPILTAFISFSCFTALAKTLGKMSERRGNSWYLSSTPDFKGKLRFTVYMIIVGFFVDTLSFRIRKSSSVC